MRLGRSWSICLGIKESRKEIKDDIGRNAQDDEHSRISADSIFPKVKKSE